MHFIQWVWSDLTLDGLSQWSIFLGAMAVFFVGNGNRWGFVCGLLAQPAWFYTTIAHQQWGLVAACFIYLFGWSIGFYRTFIKRTH